MRCKVGDLAYIRQALRPENIGKTVVCKEHLGFLRQFEKFMWNGEQWMSPDTDDLWVIENSGGLSTLFGNSKQAVIPDSWLTPIRGEPSENLEEEIAEDLGKILETINND